jgi:hypothetical protein
MELCDGGTVGDFPSGRSPSIRRSALTVDFLVALGKGLRENEICQVLLGSLRVRLPDASWRH